MISKNKEISEQEEVIYPTVDTILYADDWAKGFLDGQVVVEFGGVTDINAVELYDVKGKKVKPTPAPKEPTLVDLLERIQKCEDRLSRIS